MTTAELSDWLRGVAAEVAATKPDYPLNVARGCPIPFFGDVLNARVLTIGVNPSDKEVTKGRLWFEPLSFLDWQKRLLNYFNWPDVPPYCWFETWSICLELLGLSYAAGEAAHLDVSPRPTTPMLDKATDKAEFRAMAEHDVKWFFELLGKLPQIQLLVVAGPIPRANGSKQQLGDFISEHSEAHGCEWLEGQPLPKLRTPSRREGIPVFVCPYELGVDGLYAMVRQVYRNRDLLRGLTARSGPQSVWDWSSAIGNFIINFGLLDLHVQDFLESLLSAEEFLKVKERPFYERVEIIAIHLYYPGAVKVGSPAKQTTGRYCWQADGGAGGDARSGIRRRTGDCGD